MFLNKKGKTQQSQPQISTYIGSRLELLSCSRSTETQIKPESTQSPSSKHKRKQVGLFQGPLQGLRIFKKPKLDLLGLLAARKKPSQAFQRPWAQKCLRSFPNALLSSVQMKNPYNRNNDIPQRRSLMILNFESEGSK